MSIVASFLLYLSLFNINNLDPMSENNLIGVDPNLVKVVRRASELSSVDFVVFEGLRSLERQKVLVRTGKSKTMRSRHLTGKAVDLVPILNGKIVWDWPALYIIAEAMRQAANELKVEITWGAAWHRPLSGHNLTARQLSRQYVTIRRSQGRRPFMDGPHFQVPLT